MDRPTADFRAENTKDDEVMHSEAAGEVIASQDADGLGTRLEKEEDGCPKEKV